VSLSILSLIALPEAIQEEIRAADPSVALSMAPGWFDGEVRETWPAYTTERYLGVDSTGRGTRAERDALLISAASDIGSHRGAALFVENLHRYITGEPLENVIDWQRGY